MMKLLRVFFVDLFVLAQEDGDDGFFKQYVSPSTKNCEKHAERARYEEPTSFPPSMVECTVEYFITHAARAFSPKSTSIWKYMSGFIKNGHNDKWVCEKNTHPIFAQSSRLFLSRSKGLVMRGLPYVPMPMGGPASYWVWYDTATILWYGKVCTNRFHRPKTRCYYYF
eukprot:scaffold1452_cov174-Amphora_coffeaeformis.AAC.5